MVFLIQFSVTKIIKAFFLSWAMLYPPRAHFMFSTAQGIANHNFFIKRISIIESQLPSFFNNFDPRAAAANFPSGAQAYLAGLTFALAVSPCSTPVLATLLGYVAASKSLLSFRKFSAWINPMRYFLPIFWH